MEDVIRFGPSGNCEMFYSEGNKHSYQAPAWLKSKGLLAYEYSFGRGFTLKEDTAKIIGEEAKKNGVLVSAHAPYYINLANTQEEMIQKSFNYITKGLELLDCLGGEHYVVHLASCGKLSRAEALNITRKNLDRALQLVYDLKLDSNNKKICPETMGKQMQIGDYDEIIDFCTMDKILVPTFDFGHINALHQGCLKTYDDYKKIIDLAIEKLGDRVKNCHIHFSKIEYGDKGEIKHLTLDDNVYGPEFEPLAQLIYDYKLTPTIISESKQLMTRDSLRLKQIYDMVKNG